MIPLAVLEIPLAEIVVQNSAIVRGVFRRLRRDEQSPGELDITGFMGVTLGRKVDPISSRHRGSRVWEADWGPLC
jgi:hypothetical protein